MVVAFALLAAVPAISPQRFEIGYHGPVALAKDSAYGNVIVATVADVITVNEDGDATSKSVAGGGSAVTISDDGTFVAVRADNGVVEVYELDSEGCNKYEISISPGNVEISLSLSGNGSVLVVGVPSIYYPSAVVYEWDGWAYNARSTETGAQNSEFGASVSVSEDGSRFVVGARAFNNSEGAAFVYEDHASAGSTAQLGEPLSVSGTTNFGLFVRMSSDGNVVLATTRYDTYQYEWSGTAWSEPTLVFADLGPDPDTAYSVGNQVALSGDGTIAARVDAMGSFGSSMLITRIKFRIKDLGTGAEAVGEWDGPDCSIEPRDSLAGDGVRDCQSLGAGGIDLNSDGTVMVIAAWGEIRAYHRDGAGSWDLTDPTATTTAAPTTAAPTTAAPTTAAASNAESDGLSDASIAGIVAASVVGAAVLGFVAYRIYTKDWNVFGRTRDYGAVPG